MNPIENAKDFSKVDRMTRKMRMCSIKFELVALGIISLLLLAAIGLTLFTSWMGI